MGLLEPETKVEKANKTLYNILYEVADQWLKENDDGGWCELHPNSFLDLDQDLTLICGHCLQEAISHELR